MVDDNSVTIPAAIPVDGIYYLGLLVGVQSPRQRQVLAVPCFIGHAYIRQNKIIIKKYCHCPMKGNKIDVFNGL